MRCLICSLFLLLRFFVSYSQAEAPYPQNYFGSPLKIPLQLSANFGDLRTDHFHMGLDIRTQGRENVPVYAPADGYISRVKIEKWGYGRALYITHPNGYTTVYGHLNSFYDTLQKYLVEKQYAEEQWDQDFVLLPNQFPVSKGQFIALSGNTGGSAGPHLHFEIRDTKTEININPELFGIKIADDIAPSVSGLYWYDRRYSTYQASANAISIKQTGNEYNTISRVVKVGSPLISLGVKTLDRKNGSPFHFGIYQAELWLEDSLMNAFQLNAFSYDDTRYINGSIDYSYYRGHKSFIQYLFRLPGNKLNIFTEAAGDGVIIFSDTLPHLFRIVLKDIHDNMSMVNVTLQYDPSMQEEIPYPPGATGILPSMADSILYQSVKAVFDTGTFYDAVPMIIRKISSARGEQLSDAYSIGTSTVPVHKSYSVSITTNNPVTADEQQHALVELINGTNKIYANGSWAGNTVTASFNRMGDVRVVEDTIAPKIQQVGWTNATVFSGQKTLRLRCTDNFGEIADFTAALDGQWLLFSERSDDFIYSFDKYCAPGKHNLHVSVTDMAGNTTEKDFTVIKKM